MCAVLSLPAAPTGFPQNVTILETTSTIIEVEWDPVPIDQRNGLITFYEVELNQTMFLQELQSELRPTSGPQLNISLTELQAFVEYTIRVRANNSAGYGPFGPSISGSTLTDSKWRISQSCVC